MFIYYALILASVVMFGGGFALQNIYRKKRGSHLRISMESACIGSVAGLIVLLIINGFSIEITSFTLSMALWATVNNLVLTFCTFKALDYINLSLYSLFSMLGGMVLPFFQGILFYGEGFSVAKGICVAFICAALACTVEMGEKKKGTVFYIGVFVLNGMSGVISKLYTSSAFDKADAASYNELMAVCTAILAGAVWCGVAFVEKRKSAKKPHETAPKRSRSFLGALWAVVLFGAVNKVANYLLVIALYNVDASVQYPMVTGGTMIVSTLISYFGDSKPSKKELLSIVLAFIGMLALFVIPI